MDVTDVIGDFGTVQKRVFVVCIFRSIVLVSLMYTVQFTSGDINHWCAPVDPYTNLSTSEWQQCCVPQNSPVGDRRCQRFEITADGRIDNSTVAECHKWAYAEEDRNSSFVPEWDLVCDRRWIVSLFYTLFSMGSLLSYGPSGYLADRFGRRPAILIGVAAVTLTTVSTGLSNSIYMFGLSRFLAGAGYSFIQHVLLTLFIELSGKKQRSFVQMIFNGFWGMGLIITAGISLLVPNWSYFILISTLPFELILLLSGFRFLPESPRWLLASKKYARAEKELSELAEINGITITNKASVMEALKQKMELTSTSPENVSIAGFLNSKKLLIISAILFFTNTAKSFIGSGLNISLRHFGGIAQVNYMVHGLSGVLAVGAYHIIKSFHKPQRTILISCYVVTGLGFLGTLLVADDLHWLRLALVMTGNVLKKVASASLFIIASEVFPTHMRGKGIGAFMFSGRVGSVLASFTDLLGYRYGRDASMILFGVICFVICFVILFLPDMEDRALPDSLQEAKQITEKKIPNPFLGAVFKFLSAKKSKLVINKTAA